MKVLRKVVTAAAVLTALAIIMSLTGCISVSYGGAGRNTIVGKGEIITEVFNIGEFSELTIRIHARLNMSDNDSDEVRIELYENWGEFLDVNIINGCLVIESEKNFRTGWDSKIPQIYVSSQTLESLIISGVVELGEISTITSETFRFKSSGVSSGKLDLMVNELDIDISGVGDITLSGIAEKADINSSGIGNLKAFGLDIKEAKVKVSGVGSVEISCSETLDAKLSGVGGISYKGNPDVTQNRSGIGSITKVD